LNANDPGSSAYLPWESVPLVSTYVDEVPMFVNLNLTDIERVEVLRGPQGTLYGSGAVAGTIRIIHNQPDPTRFDAELSLDAADTSHAANGSYTADGLLNIPISETAALRVNASYKEVSGFINASNAVVFNAAEQPALANPASPLTSGFRTESLRDIDAALSTYFRASLLWHSIPGVDTIFAYQRQDDHSNAFSRQSAGQSYTDGAYIPLAPDHRVVDLSSVTLSADVGFATVTSSTSYAKNHDQSDYDESPFLLNYNSLSPLYYGSYPRPTTEFFLNSTDKSLVEELRLVSKEGGPLDYVVGGFFRHEYNDLFQYETVPGFAAWSQLPGSADAVNQVLGSNYANFGDYIVNYNGGTRPSSLAPLDTNYTYQRESGFKDRALYGELTWHVTSQWQITGGVRVFWQDVSENLYQTIPYGGPYFSTLPPPANLTDALGSTIAGGEQLFHNHLFKLNSGYALTPTLRLYATYSEGFRHGGANANAIGTCAFCDSPNTAYFQPDTVKNYEVGFKGTAENWLRFSAALYRMHWNDIQIQLFDATDSAYVANGGTAVSQGVELELETQLGHGWSATFGYGYTDAKVTSDFSITDRGETLLSAQNGDRLPYVPEQTLTAGIGYTRHLSSEIGLDVHADASYRSDVTTEINSTAASYQVLGGFTTVDAAAGLQFDGHWRAKLYCTNLTNQAGVSAAGPVLRNADFYPNYREEYVIRPRTVGLNLSYRLK
jgi:outer membrane receptor protein involved in Fe transport